MTEQSFDDVAKTLIADGNDARIQAILKEICDTTGMGFAAVSRVNDSHWTACQVLDRVEFGLKPGDELAIATTICGDVRRTGERIVIDHVADNPDWATHPIPVIFGFKSYASLPIRIDGEFFGTLCAIDPQPRTLSAATTIELLNGCALRVAELLRPHPG